MDVVEFAEKVCGCFLSEYDREFLRKSYDTIKNNKQTIYIPARGSSKFKCSTLQNIAIIKVAQERGLLS